MSNRLLRVGVALIAASFALVPARAAAQEWEFTLAPIYLWAMETNGSITAADRNVPVFLDFADAADNLGGAFSFHFEARKGRWGGFTDFNFVRLSSETEYVTATPLARTIEGDFNLDIQFFEAGASYVVHEPARVAVIGGLRTYTLGSQLTFSTPNVDLTAIDASRTVADVFVGFTARPALTPRLALVSRADIGGGGSEVTWSALIGLEFRLRPSIGLVFGYKALGIDAGADEGAIVREYDMTHYGPIFGLNLHWGRD